MAGVKNPIIPPIIAKIKAVVRICLRDLQIGMIRSLRSISSSELDGDGVLSVIAEWFLTTKRIFFNHEFHELGEEHGR